MPETCPHCGVVVEKFLKRQKAGPAITPPSPLHEASVSPRKRYKYLLIGLLAAVIASVLYKFAPDLKLDEHYVLTRSIWQGDMSYLGKKHPFVLVIESVENGQLEGYMDWVGFSPRYRLAIRGSYKGNHLLFVDYKFLEGSGGYGLNDKKDVYIIENEMLGTDKNGNATLRAVKRESIPM